MKSSKSIIKRNQKVAKNRGEIWQSKLKEGRLDAQLNPTKLKVKRVKLQISQDEMSTLLNLHRSTYGAIERSKRLVSEKRASLIAEKVKDQKDSLFRKDKSGLFRAVLA